MTMHLVWRAVVVMGVLLWAARPIAHAQQLEGTALTLDPAVAPSLEQPVGEIEELDLADLLGVVSSVSKRDEKAQTAPASVAILTREQLVRHGYQTVGEALRAVPGLYVSSGRDHYYLGVRGLSLPTDVNSRVLVLLDGHTLNNPWSGSADLGDLATAPILAIERIEVVRGPSSSIYGSNAFFAVVNIVSTRPTESEPHRVAAEAAWGTHRRGRASAAAHTRHGLLDISLFAAALDGRGPSVDFDDMTRPRLNLGAPTETEGRTDGTDFERGMGVGGLLKWRGLNLQARHYERSKGLPTAPGDAVFDDPFNSTAERHSYAELGFEERVGAHRFNLRLYADSFYAARFLHRDPSDWPDGTWTNDDPHSVMRGTDLTVGSEARASITLPWSQSLLLGLEAQKHYVEQQAFELVADRLAPSFGEPDESTLTGAVRDSQGRLPDIELYNVAAYVQGEQRLAERWAVVAGIRWDWNSVFIAEGLRAITPRFSVVFTPTDTSTLKLLYGEAFRNPTIFEAYFDDQASLCGNVDAQAERQRTLEVAGATRWSEYLDLTGSVFATRVSDLLVRRSLPQCYVDSGPRVRFENSESIDVYGAQAEARAALPRGVAAFASATFAEAHRDTSTNSQQSKHLPNSPHWVASGGASVPLVPERLFLSADLTYLSRRKAWTVADRNDEAPVLRIDIALVARQLLGGLTTSLKVHNLLDTRYRDPVTAGETIPTAVPQDGIVAIGTVGYEW